jgi:hypothetical protein
MVALLDELGGLLLVFLDDEFVFELISLRS